MKDDFDDDFAYSPSKMTWLMILLILIKDDFADEFAYRDLDTPHQYTYPSK
jgi:hypothetical protein